MVYKGDIPLATDKLNISQGDIKENFSQAGIIFNADHAAFDDATVASRGKHEQTTLLHKTTDPSTASGEGKVYIVKSGTTRYLRYREESDGTVHNLTGGSTAGNVFAWGNVETKSPTNILSSYNVDTAIISLPLTPTPTVSIKFLTPASSTNYTVMLTPFNTGATNSLTMSVTKSVDGFDYYCIYSSSQPSLGVSFLVIGG